MKIKIILSLLTFSIIISCKNEPENYEYYDGFARYISESFNISLEKANTTFFLLPVDGCDSCIDLNVDMLSKTRYDVQLILIGSTYDKKRLNRLKKIMNIYTNALVDNEFLISQYRTGFSKPMIVTVKNGKYNYHLYVNDFKVNEAEAYLKENLLQ